MRQKNLSQKYFKFRYHYYNCTYSRKKSSILISSEDILSMKSGSIILDMASEHGGNTSLTQPNSEIVTENGVNILGVANIPSTCPTILVFFLAIIF